jgi:predicted nucleic acid-binding protein
MRSFQQDFGRADLDRELVMFELDVSPMSRDALFLSGQVFRRYRARGRMRTNVLADFCIGALAEVQGWTILTRDAKRYRTYFPQVEVVEP